jgi:two-component system NtrC family sensor kinase
MNLLVNAAHAITEKGVITLSTSQVDSWVEIGVSDTGSGISPEHIQKIFEPFFTTKEVGKGTGLGLAISADIVRKHGGELLVRSVPGTGTTFTVRLPIGEERKII